MIRHALAVFNSDPPDAAPSPEEVGIPWPWCDLIRHALRADDAFQRSIAAGTRGDIDGRLRADFDRYDALGDHLKVKEEVASFFLTGLRFALELQPAGLALLLGNLPVPRNVDDRLDQLEDAVLDLEDANRQAVPV